MRIAYDNLLDDGTLTESSQNTAYPAENVQDQRLAKPWRTLVLTAVTCIVNLGSAKAIDTIAIIGHNLTTSATITVNANAADSWGSPSYTTSLTALDNMVLKYLTTAQTYQYWRFNLDDSTNTNAYLSIGRLWLGAKLDIDPASTNSFRVSKRRSDTVTYGRGRQKFATPGSGWRSFSFNFRRTSGSMLTAIQTMYDTVGNHSSLIFSNFNALRSYEIVEPCYCSIVGNIDFAHQNRMRFDYALEIEEDK